MTFPWRDLERLYTERVTRQAPAYTLLLGSYAQGTRDMYYLTPAGKHLWELKQELDAARKAAECLEE